MLTCPACTAPVAETSVYNDVPILCPACGARVVLDQAGRSVEGRIAWVLGTVVIGGGIFAGLGLLPLWAFFLAVALVTAGAIAFRPRLLARYARLVRFE
jgi:DNA-directed RNA polymerase subunit RPC12/RpoP